MKCHIFGIHKAVAFKAIFLTWKDKYLCSHQSTTCIHHYPGPSLPSETPSNDEHQSTPLWRWPANNFHSTHWNNFQILLLERIISSTRVSQYLVSLSSVGISVSEVLCQLDPHELGIGTKGRILLHIELDLDHILSIHFEGKTLHSQLGREQFVKCKGNPTNQWSYIVW